MIPDELFARYAEAVKQLSENQRVLLVNMRNLHESINSLVAILKITRDRLNNLENPK